MTQQRLEQLRGNLANLRDSTDDYRAAVLAQWAVWVCDGYAVSHEDSIISRAVHRRIERLADALGVAPDGEDNNGN